MKTPEHYIALLNFRAISYHRHGNVRVICKLLVGEQNSKNIDYTP